MLAAFVWIREISRAHRVADAIKAGTALRDCQDGANVVLRFGIYKQFGFGREPDLHSLELYTQVKSV